MPALTPQIISRAGLVNPTTVAAAAPDSFPNSGRTIFVCLNSTAADTFAIAVQAGQCSDANVSVGPVVIADDVYIGPFPVATFGNNVVVTGITAANTIAALELAT